LYVASKRDTTKFINSNPWALDKINKQSMGASNEHGFLAKEKKGRKRKIERRPVN